MKSKNKLSNNLKFNQVQWLVIRNIVFVTLVTLLLSLSIKLIRIAFNVAFYA